MVDDLTLLTQLAHKADTSRVERLERQIELLQDEACLSQAAKVRPPPSSYVVVMAAFKQRFVRLDN
jgi:hypothetical protein